MHTSSDMIRLALLWTLLATTLVALSGKEVSGNEAAAENVNTRYTVESVKLTGGTEDSTLTRSTRKEMDQLVGQKLDTHAVERIATRIQHELGVERIRVRIGRGTRPEHVAVQLEIQRRDDLFDMSVPKIAYHSRQGFSGMVQSTHTWGSNRALVRYVNDGDLLAERYSGFQGGYQRRRLPGASRVGLRVMAHYFHQQWNEASQNTAAQIPGPDGSLVAGGSGIYRNRVAIEPEVTVMLAPGLNWSTGVSVQHLEMQFPAARTEASNAVTTTLRLSRRLEGSGDYQQDIDAGYSLRAATRSLGSDFVFNRHAFNASWALHNGHHHFRAAAMAGVIGGTAPYYERFVLGNGSTLRGWSKYDIAPLGADRAAHGSAEYRYRVVEIFYDAGSVWQRSGNPDMLQSVGGGFRKDGFQLAVAFPLRSGSIDPVFLVGVNF